MTHGRLVRLRVRGCRSDWSTELSSDDAIPAERAGPNRSVPAGFANAAKGLSRKVWVLSGISEFEIDRPQSARECPPGVSVWNRGVETAASLHRAPQLWQCCDIVALRRIRYTQEEQGRQRQLAALLSYVRGARNSLQKCKKQLAES